MRRLGIKAGLVLLLILVLSASVVMATSVTIRNTNASSEAFMLESKKLQLGMTKAIEWYPRALYGLRGLFVANVFVGREQFRLYVDNLFGQQTYPGVQAFSYVEKVCGAESDTATSTGRDARVVTGSGCVAPSVITGLPPGEHFVVKYIKGINGESETLVGSDVWSIDTRRMMMEKAVESDSVIFSSLTELLSNDPSDGEERGLVAYLPIYAKGISIETPEERWAALVGFVGMSFKSNEFFSEIFRQIGADPGLSFYLFDDVAGGNELVYSSGEARGVKSPDEMLSNEGVQIYRGFYSNFGKNWSLLCLASSDFNVSDNQAREPYVWLVMGTLILACIMLVYLAVSHAEAVARRAAVETASDRRLLELLMESLPVGVVISSTPAGYFARMNAVGRALLGREMDISVNRDNYAEHFDLIREDGTRYPVDELPLAKTLKNGRPAYARDVYVRRPDGSIRAMRLTSALVRGDSERMSFVIMIGEDISREVAVEKARVDFASLAAHQLKTPPVAIKWCVEMLADPLIGKLNRKQKEYADRIMSLSEKMRESVDALLVISRLEIGTFRIDPKPIDLAALVEAEVATFSEEAKDARIKLIFVIPGKVLPKPTSDGRLIGMVVHNLVENAIRYTRKGGEVRVSVTKGEKELVVSVADTGIGIPSNQQYRIFERFFRADNAVEVTGEGSGLGLSVVKTICDRIGCRVTFESEEDKGTVFLVRVPLNGAFPVRENKPA